MRKMISGLLRSSRPVLLMTALVAVVGITGTAYAKHDPGNRDDDSSAAVEQTQSQQSNSHGDKADGGNRSDRGGKHRKGHKGHHGNGNTDDAEYGVASVWVSRGGNPATAWATYSTLLGSPIGDNTGGVFRFTCFATTPATNCTVSLKAAVLSDSAGTTAVYPRILIYKQDLGGGPEVYCEYGDGSTGSAPLAITHQAPSATPTWTPVPVHIGGSDDCGLGGPAGAVDQITVPAGYYDVKSTFVFLP